MTDETQRFRADGPADPGDALLGQLRRVAALVDPVPEALVHAARETLTWRRVDAELAELLSDSALEEAGFALVRGHGEPRAVSFARTASSSVSSYPQRSPRSRFSPPSSVRR